MQVIQNIVACREAVRAARAAGRSVGFVPTMGALHAGHASLMDVAQARCRFVAVSVFVNPTQFGPNEDFAAYPRTFDADLRLCQSRGVDLVFAPSAEEMYPGECGTSVHVRRLADGLCGAFRPGHFDGVATGVSKLFHIVPADYAFFGEKDYQQLVVIQRMVADLNMPIIVVGCPTVREPDGVAMSSRNAYLDPAQRRQARAISQALFHAARLAGDGEADSQRLKEGIAEQLRASGPCRIEYIEAVDAATLEPLEHIDRPGRICLAVRLGTCRLIDNVAVDALNGMR